jgi:hypothetical protein
MKTYKVLIIVFLTACCNRPASSPIIEKSLNDWTGEYVYSSREYTDGAITLPRTYTLKITSDTCRFWGAGFQLYFIDLCTADISNDTIFIRYLKRIEGYSLEKEQSYVNKLFRKNGKYYINSPEIYNDDWKNNVDIEIIKTK